MTAGTEDRGDNLHKQLGLLNDPTGLHISDGDPSVGRLLGASSGLRSYSWFLTQEHGENTVWRINVPR